jgi:dipeptidyl aminopeptidase/acylaminoacyl peptidase
LVWRDRRGTRIGAVGPPADAYFYPSLSPDGRRVAAEVQYAHSQNIWVIDVDRGTRVRLSSPPSTEIVPTWSPEGDQVAYGSYRAGNIDIFARQSDAGGEEVTIAANPSNERISDWSPDGQYILYSFDPGKRSDLAFLKQEQDGKWQSHPLLQTAASQRSAKFSPDGRYIAYLSDETGRNELYVREWPAGGRKWPVSVNGASQVRWNGKEIFYTEAGTLIAVPVNLDGGFTVGTPIRLFSHPMFNRFTDPNYDVVPDGQRIIVPERIGEQERVIHVLQNWSVGFTNLGPATVPSSAPQR